MIQKIVFSQRNKDLSYLKKDRKADKKWDNLNFQEKSLCGVNVDGVYEKALVSSSVAMITTVTNTNAKIVSIKTALRL